MKNVRLCLIAIQVLIFASASYSQRFTVHESHNVGDVDTFPYAICTADFNGDRYIDIVVGGQNDACIYLYINDGSGNFSYLDTYVTALLYLENIYSADLDNDNDMDLMVCGCDEEVYLFYNNGDGTFDLPVTITATGESASLCHADFNGDGRLDLAVADRLFGGEIYLFLGEEGGGFEDGVLIHEGPRITTIATDDFDLDGDYDLAFSSLNNIQTKLNNGDGTFADETTWDTMGYWRINRMSTADLNNDTYPDLVFGINQTDDFDNSPYVMLNAGNGTFLSAVRVLSWLYRTNSVCVADLNLDGYLDIAHTEEGGGNNSGAGFNFNNGEANFQIPDSVLYINTHDTNIPNKAITVADFDLDCDPDIAVVNDSLVIIKNNAMFLELSVTPHPDYPLIPPGGGTFIYDVNLINNSDMDVTFTGWTFAILPNQNIYQDLTRTGLVIEANSTREFFGIPVQVPWFAPPGVYRYFANVTITSPPLLLTLRDCFYFEKSGGQGTIENVMTWGGGYWDDNLQVYQAPIATECAIENVYPNPFNQATTISISLPTDSELKISIYNCSGQELALLANEKLDAGLHEFTFDASSYASGMYFVNAEVLGKWNAVEKLILIK